MEDILKQNEALADISREMFGDSMCLMVVEPAKLVLLKDNARYFKRETFRQLRDNIAADKRLSSVPLCYQLEDGKLEVLSGNHRVKASIEAEIEKIMVLVITEELEKSRRISIQLSHNALVGEDDQSILANLWARIDSVADKLYSGLDSEIIHELGDVELVNFSAPAVPVHMVTFMFTEGEKDRLSEILDMLTDASKSSKAVYVVEKSQYTAFTKMIAEIKGAEKIRDSSLAIIRLLEIAEEYLAADKIKTENVKTEKSKQEKKA